MNENALLASLPVLEKQRLMPRLESVILPRGRVLYEPDDVIHYAYFPRNGLISLLATAGDDEVVEIGLVTRSGFVGLPIVLCGYVTPFQVVVRIATAALRMRADVLREELRRRGALETALLRYAHEFAVDVSTLAVCHHSHTAVQRLSAWFLAVREAVHADTFRLTHESIAHTLGLQRTIVTQTALELQDAGLISYRHGRVLIRDPQALAARACTCRRATKKRSAFSPATPPDVLPNRADKDTHFS